MDEDFKIGDFVILDKSVYDNYKVNLTVNKIYKIIPGTNEIIEYYSFNNITTPCKITGLTFNNNISLNELSRLFENHVINYFLK